MVVVNVAEKVYGYSNATGNPFTRGLLSAIDSVDKQLGTVVDKLKAKNLYNDTLIIVASKHGQAPINPALYAKIDPQLIENDIGVPIQWQTSDDIALIFLNNTQDTKTAVSNLNKNKAALKIKNIIYGQELIAQGYGDPTRDPAVPNIIVEPELGIIYTTSKKKISEHGGLSADDRNVACFVSSPRLQKRVFDERVYTRQIAPLILRALGANPQELEAVRLIGTRPLPGF